MLTNLRMQPRHQRRSEYDASVPNFSKYQRSGSGSQFSLPSFANLRIKSRVISHPVGIFADRDTPEPTRIRHTRQDLLESKTPGNGMDRLTSFSLFLHILLRNDGNNARIQQAPPLTNAVKVAGHNDRCLLLMSFNGSLVIGLSKGGYN